MADILFTSSNSPDVPLVSPFNSHVVGFLLKVMDMMPDVDRGQLLRECAKCPDCNISFGKLVRKLKEQRAWRKRKSSPVKHTKNDFPTKKVQDTTGERNHEEQVACILASLPDADPEFIRQSCDKLKGDQNLLIGFFYYCMNKKEYPTKKDFEQRQQYHKVMEKYTTGFNISDYLKQIPDPLKYFTEKNTGHVHKDLSLNFLKDRYRAIACRHIEQLFISHDMNLTKTCIELDSSSSTNEGGRLRALRRKCNSNFVVNISFIQEMAFVNHRLEILEYIEEKKQRRQENYTLALKNNSFWECSICYDGEVLVEETLSCNEGHIFCKSCVRTGIEGGIGLGKNVFVCFEKDCSAEFSLKVLEELLSESALASLLARRQSEEIKAACIEGLEMCPHCEFAIIPAPNDKIFKCLNPDCLRETCRSCHLDAHIPIRCNQVESSKDTLMRTYVENKMTEALIRQCWKCNRKFVKEEGCNKMSCSCGAMMCYICRQPVRDYSHFDDRQEAVKRKLCPLYSDLNVLHVDTVQEAARRAKLELAVDDLKNDPSTVYLKRDPNTQANHSVTEQQRKDTIEMVLQFGSTLKVPEEILAEDQNINMPGPSGLANNVVEEQVLEQPEPAQQDQQQPEPAQQDQQQPEHWLEQPQINIQDEEVDSEEIENEARGQPNL